MHKILFLSLACLCSHWTMAQYHPDFLGAGHDTGITVTTSHHQDSNAKGNKTIDGFPFQNTEQVADASRFLAQATLGADYETIEMAAAMGYETWIDEQFILIQQPTLPLLQPIFDLYNDDPLITEIHRDFFRSAWSQATLSAPDLLRHRVNLALSEIFVISDRTELFEDNSVSLSHYYDMLGEQAFGTYEQLLREVTLHPSMGIYLSHFNNPKADLANNIHPDENYAREIMQLFSIGLHELNMDGSEKLDENGQLIPTYGHFHISNFAKVFTGLGDGSADGEFEESSDTYEMFTSPMRMYEEWHEPSSKTLLNGYMIPANQPGMQDINQTVTHLSNHLNVAPFISKALIQLLVSSNPSPDYIERVANIFVNNGNGERGDLQAVLKAILLDPEARICDATTQATIGKLRSPLLRHSNFLKAFNAFPTLDGGYFFHPMETFRNATGQAPMSAPSVFNFYLPNYQPNGPIADADLVAPVFQIHNASTAIGILNEMNQWTRYARVIDNELDIEGPSAAIDISDELALANDATVLVERLNVLLANGQLSTATKTTIENAIVQLGTAGEKVNLAIYLILLSPDYAILK